MKQKFKCRKWIGILEKFRYEFISKLGWNNDLLINTVLVMAEKGGAFIQILQIQIDINHFIYNLVNKLY